MGHRPKTQSDAMKRRASITQDYKRIFTSTSGKRVLKDMMNTHNFLTSSFSAGDTNETFFREGERNVILRILNLLHIDTDEMLKQIEEIQDESY
jgi:hypothetical protein